MFYGYKIRLSNFYINRNYHPGIATPGITDNPYYTNNQSYEYHGFGVINMGVNARVYRDITKRVVVQLYGYTLIMTTEIMRREFKGVQRVQRVKEFKEFKVRQI
jgi:hypothetical protein